MKSRIKEDDSSVPYKYNGYWYITKYEKGKDYPIYTRKKETLEAAEELLFDCNEMAKDHSYFRLVGLNINPNNDLISYGLIPQADVNIHYILKTLKPMKFLRMKFQIQRVEYLGK